MHKTADFLQEILSKVVERNLNLSQEFLSDFLVAISLAIENRHLLSLKNSDFSVIFKLLAYTFSLPREILQVRLHSLSEKLFRLFFDETSCGTDDDNIRNFHLIMYLLIIKHLTQSERLDILKNSSKNVSKSFSSSSLGNSSGPVNKQPKLSENSLLSLITIQFECFSTFYQRSLYSTRELLLDLITNQFQGGISEQQDPTVLASYKKYATRQETKLNISEEVRQAGGEFLRILSLNLSILEEKNHDLSKMNSLFFDLDKAVVKDLSGALPKDSHFSKLRTLIDRIENITRHSSIELALTHFKEISSELKKFNSMARDERINTLILMFTLLMKINYVLVPRLTRPDNSSELPQQQSSSAIVEEPPQGAQKPLITIGESFSENISLIHEMIESLRKDVMQMLMDSYFVFKDETSNDSDQSVLCLLRNLHDFSRFSDFDFSPMIDKLFSQGKVKQIFKLYSSYDEEGKIMTHVNEMLEKLRKNNLPGYINDAFYFYTDFLSVFNKPLASEFEKKNLKERLLLRTLNEPIFLSILYKEHLSLFRNLQKLMPQTCTLSSQGLRSLLYHEVNYMIFKKGAKGYQGALDFDLFLPLVPLDIRVDQKKEYLTLLVKMQKYSHFTNILLIADHFFAKAQTKENGGQSIIFVLERLIRKLIENLVSNELKQKSDVVALTLYLMKRSGVSIAKMNLKNVDTEFFLLVEDILNNSYLNSGNFSSSTVDLLESFITVLINYPLKKPKLEEFLKSQKETLTDAKFKTWLSEGLFHPYMKLLDLLLNSNATSLGLSFPEAGNSNQVSNEAKNNNTPVVERKAAATAPSIRKPADKKKKEYSTNKMTRKKAHEGEKSSKFKKSNKDEQERKMQLEGEANQQSQLMAIEPVQAKFDLVEILEDLYKHSISHNLDRLRSLIIQKELKNRLAKYVVSRLTLPIWSFAEVKAACEKAAPAVLQGEGALTIEIAYQTLNSNGFTNFIDFLTSLTKDNKDLSCKATFKEFSDHILEFLSLLYSSYLDSMGSFFTSSTQSTPQVFQLKYQIFKKISGFALNSHKLMQLSNSTNVVSNISHLYSLVSASFSFLMTYKQSEESDALKGENNELKLQLTYFLGDLVTFALTLIRLGEQSQKLSEGGEKIQNRLLHTIPEEEHEIPPDEGNPLGFKLQNLNPAVASYLLIDDNGSPNKALNAKNFLSEFNLNISGKRPNTESQELCTYTINLKNKEKFIEQHYYQCYQCDLIDGKGCCSICAFRCHANHDISYSKKAPFYCDCGFSNCQSMKAADKSYGKMKKLIPAEVSKMIPNQTKASGPNFLSAPSNLGGGLGANLQPPESMNPGQNKYYNSMSLFGGLPSKTGLGSFGGLFGAPPMNDPFMSTRTMPKELISEKNFDMMIPARILGDDLSVVNIGRVMGGNFEL
jgi:hypothetical protein